VRKIMRKIAAAIFVWLALVISPGSALALEKLITVSGEAMTSAAPDIVTIRLGVATQGDTARKANETNAKVMNAVLAAIKAAGVEERGIQTSRLSLQPQFEQKPNGPPHLTGFRASNDVTVKLNDVGKLSDLIDRAVAAGANEMSGLEFSLSDHAKRLDEARAQAVEDARRKAEIYAKAAGVVVGRPVSITENTVSSPPRPVAAATFRGAPTPVAPGEVTLHAAVTMSFELTQ
jgi:uncharacterized protein YggE